MVGVERYDCRACGFHAGASTKADEGMYDSHEYGCHECGYHNVPCAAILFVRDDRGL